MSCYMSIIWKSEVWALLVSPVEVLMANIYICDICIGFCINILICHCCLLHLVSCHALLESFKYLSFMIFLNFGTGNQLMLINLSWSWLPFVIFDCHKNSLSAVVSVVAWVILLPAGCQQGIHQYLDLLGLILRFFTLVDSSTPDFIGSGWGMVPQKLYILRNFRMWTPSMQGISLTWLLDNFQVSWQFHGRLMFQIWLYSLNGFQSYGGLNSRVCPQTFSAP